MPNPPRPTVSIIIPAWNEEATIERSVRAALDQTESPLEVIVVDNKSTDRTAEIVAGLARADGRVRLLHQRELQGIVPTRDLGFEAARGEVLGRIDADSIIDRHWVARVAERMSAPTVGAVTGPVGYYDLPFATGGRVADDLMRRMFLRLGRKYPFLYGSNMAIRAGAWRRIRRSACSDPDDLFHEDIDLAIHLFDEGIPVGYEPRMIAGVSARRMDSTPDAFREYTERFDRTYRAHHIRLWHLRAPQLMLSWLYWPIHTARRMFPATRLA